MLENARFGLKGYALSGAIGGLVGFLLMEPAQLLLLESLHPIPGSMIYFAGFGLAVGAALGATEGIRSRDRGKIAYGLCAGLVLGAVGGAIGGAVGQVLFALLSNAIPTLARGAGWAALGLLVGLGQGVRENTREDLLACGLGGLVGGICGGLAFDPITGLLPMGGGLFGRALGDIVVGACIGVAMRTLQTQLVLKSEKPATTLLKILPKNERASALRMKPGHHA